MTRRGGSLPGGCSVTAGFVPACIYTRYEARARPRSFETHSDRFLIRFSPAFSSLITHFYFPVFFFFLKTGFLSSTRGTPQPQRYSLKPCKALDKDEQHTLW